MTTSLLPKSARCFTAAGAVMLLTMAGCIPVAWLPDSSGFVYTDGGEFQQLVHYDIAKAERRVIVEKIPASTLWPALSPDGKRVAVARLVRDADQSKTQNLQVIIYDLQGKETHRSAELAWTKDGKPGGLELLGTAVFWVASNGKLIIHSFDDPVLTGIYDPAKKTLVTVDALPSAFAGTPVRPDGTGFLANRKDPGTDALKVFLVDWDGKTQPIDMKPDAIDSEDKVSTIQFPWGGTSAWKGNVAEVSRGAVRIRIDTEKRVGTFETIPNAQAVVDGKSLVQHYAFPGGGTLRVLEEKQQAMMSKYQLEFLKPGENKPVVVKVQDKNSFILIPSPDRKWVVARTPIDDKTIFLVNGAGEVKEIAGNNDKPQ